MLLSKSQMMVPGSRLVSPGRSPFDMKFPSKRYDNGGIGLGIVAALEKSSITKTNRHEISSLQNPNRSDPVHCTRRFQFAAETDLYEEYTCVTNRDGLTKVYYNDDEFEFRENRSDSDRRWSKSTVTAEELPEKKREVFRDSPFFLSSCCLCKKKLLGKDIYMYKGDKGFCSEECRSVKIMEDNFEGKQNLRNVEALRSSYTGGQMSSTGIFVI